MEALIELLKSPEGALILEFMGLLGIVVLFSAFLWVFRDAREGRRGLHEKIDHNCSELHTRIDETQKETREEVKGLREELHDHAREDERRWGKIEGYFEARRD